METYKGELLHNSPEEIANYIGSSPSPFYRTYFKEKNKKKLYALDLQLFLEKNEISREDAYTLLKVYIEAKDLFIRKISGAI